MKESRLVRDGQGHNESRCSPGPNPYPPTKGGDQLSLGAYAQLYMFMASFTEL
jgi:hypothetical protein